MLSSVVVLGAYCEYVISVSGVSLRFVSYFDVVRILTPFRWVGFNLNLSV